MHSAWATRAAAVPKFHHMHSWTECKPLVQKSCSSGMSRYRSRVSGLEKAPRCSTVFPAITCFTATSTFLPLIVYCVGQAQKTQKAVFKPEMADQPQLKFLPTSSPKTTHKTRYAVVLNAGHSRHLRGASGEDGRRSTDTVHRTCHTRTPCLGQHHVSMRESPMPCTAPGAHAGALAWAHLGPHGPCPEWHHICRCQPLLLTNCSYLSDFFRCETVVKT